ncbi:MAG: prepilin peptidase [Enterobacteriaceae bacterium]
MVLIGLCIGSVLNVVIYRVPLMLQQAWEQELQQHKAEPQTVPVQQRTYNLFWPPSACPHCHAPIKPYDNIPLLSWLLLRGRCRACQHPIPVRYPLIELTGGVGALLLTFLFPHGVMLAGALLFSAFLLALAMIDHDKMLLPDQLTQPLLWLGLLFNLFHCFVDLSDAVLGAVAGYLTLWLIYWGFKLCSGREGLGYGDFKLLAALGAWLGWRMLPQLLIIAALVGIVLAYYRHWRHQSSLDSPMPFGSALALAGWLCLLIWHSELLILLAY